VRLSVRFVEHLRFERTCLLAAAGAGAAAALADGPFASWTVVAGGAAFALAAALVWSGDRIPPPYVAVACATAALAAWASVALLPSLSELLAAALPAWTASGTAGAVQGLWIAAACAPLHTRIASGPVDERLATAVLDLARRAEELSSERERLADRLREEVRELEKRRPLS